MAVKRNGLGKGLDSLIPNKNTVKTEKMPEGKIKKDSAEESKSGEIMVRINEVEPNREQPRKDFDEDDEGKSNLIYRSSEHKRKKKSLLRHIQ